MRIICKKTCGCLFDLIKMAEIKNLKLYMRNGCGFCVMVIREIKRLGISVEPKNIWEDEQANQDVLANTGAKVVPVLYYEDNEGNAHWMPESIDIIYFLRKHFDVSKAL